MSNNTNSNIPQVRASGGVIRNNRELQQDVANMRVALQRHEQEIVNLRAELGDQTNNNNAAAPPRRRMRRGRQTVLAVSTIC